VRMWLSSMSEPPQNCLLRFIKAAWEQLMSHLNKTRKCRRLSQTNCQNLTDCFEYIMRDQIDSSFLPWPWVKNVKVYRSMFSTLSPPLLLLFHF
jgi:hypothetical protein